MFGFKIISPEINQIKLQHVRGLCGEMLLVRGGDDPHFYLIVEFSIERDLDSKKIIKKVKDFDSVEIGVLGSQNQIIDSQSFTVYEVLELVDKNEKEKALHLSVYLHGVRSAGRLSIDRYRVWDIWRDGVPEHSRWFKCHLQEKMAWLDMIRRRHPVKRSELAGRGHRCVVDGALILDYPSFYLALGEAIMGAGGYFGASMDSLSDCLIDWFCVHSSMEIVFLKEENIRAHFHFEAWKRDKLLRYDDPDWEDAEPFDLFESILDILRSGGVSVCLSG